MKECFLVLSLLYVQGVVIHPQKHHSACEAKALCEHHIAAVCTKMVAYVYCGYFQCVYVVFVCL